jgi:hypothetical protein
MNRRGFLAILAGAPIAAKMRPALIPESRLYTGGLSHYITANVWTVGPPLTEKAFCDYLEHALKTRRD